MMVSYYQDLYGNTVTEQEEDVDTGEDSLIFTGVPDCCRLRYEIFDDNYD